MAFEQIHTVDASFCLGLGFPLDTVFSLTFFSLGCDLFTLGASCSDQFFLGSSDILPSADGFSYTTRGK